MEDVYEAPRVRDLDELGLRGQFPLGINTCSAGADSTCAVGNVNNICASGSNDGTCTAGSLPGF